MVLMAAGLPPTDEIVEKLKDAIEKYEIVSNEDNTLRVEMWCTIFMTHQAAKDKKDGVLGVLKDLDDIAKAEKFIKPNQN